MTKSIKSTSQSRSWFCVLNNPQLQFGDKLSPEQIVQAVIHKWIDGKEDSRTCAVNYEISDTGTPHCHCVLESKNPTRFSVVKKLFPTMHIEATRGKKEQAEKYIHKQGKFEEKHHTLIVAPQYYGEIKGRTPPTAYAHEAETFEMISALIDAGLKPDEIMNYGLQYRKYESLIRKSYFAKRSKETQPIRQVKVYWHCGESGTGKSYTYVKLCEEYGEDDVYLLSDYTMGAFDEYCGEHILFVDEYKGGFPYQVFLTMLDGYKTQMHARYSNIKSLWDEVHITSIYGPEEAYTKMVKPEDRDRDSLKQLIRRIDVIVFHYIENGEYKTFELPAKKYIDYKTLQQEAWKTPEDREVEKEMKQLGFSYVKDVKEGDNF